MAISEGTLLDTHAFLWWVDDDARLKARSYFLASVL
jgi:PIN domain nuclease of toxin-antitoxin system